MQADYLPEERHRMIRRTTAAAGLFMLGLAITISARDITVQTKPSQPSGWTLPEDADATKNPLTVDDKLLANGRAVYKDKCQRCHGPGGLGDGEDADPDVREDMDLTRAARADRNPDGVVFYKVSNGRRSPKMPPFKDELSKEQIWSVVAFAQSLRKK
jgi:mono/diheme cytochrome c family protein